LIDSSPVQSGQGACITFRFTKGIIEFSCYTLALEMRKKSAFLWLQCSSSPSCKSRLHHWGKTLDKQKNWRSGIW